MRRQIFLRSPSVSRKVRRYIQRAFFRVRSYKRRNIRVFQGEYHLRRVTSWGILLRSSLSPPSVVFFLCWGYKIRVSSGWTSLIRRVISCDRLLTAWFIPRILALQVDLHLVEFVRALIPSSDHVSVKNPRRLIVYAHKSDFSEFFEFSRKCRFHTVVIIMSTCRLIFMDRFIRNTRHDDSHLFSPEQSVKTVNIY